MESITGVAIGALVLAALENVLAAYTSVPTSFQDAVSFALFFVALVAFPQGLPGLFTRFQRRAIR
jgi:branched-subunit amino acid ABC-type transport system permease component